MTLSLTNIRISKLLRLALLTDKDGEALAALKYLRETLKTAKLDVHEFVDHASTFTKVEPEKVKPKVEWRAKVKFIIVNGSDLSFSDKEVKFIKDLYDSKRPNLSEKQEAWLDVIYDRVRQKVKSGRH